MQKFTFLSISMYTVTMIAYFGSAYYASQLPGTKVAFGFFFHFDLSGNIYLNNVLTGFAELIGNLITIPVIRYIGVRKTTLTFNIFAGIFMFLTLGLLSANTSR